MNYDIHAQDAEKERLYPTDAGPLDILAAGKDEKKLPVVEAKTGGAGDVVGQRLRCMTYLRDILAESDQTAHGIIVALKDDQRIRRASAMGPDIQFSGIKPASNW